MGELDDIIRDFLVESNEGLDQLDQHLVALERDPTDRDLLAAIFRCVHTIKGTCGFFGFSNLESVTHAGENLLGRLRDGELLLNAEITSALLATVDAVRAMLVTIEQTGSDGGEGYAALIRSLEQLAGDGQDTGGERASPGRRIPKRGASSRKSKRTAKRSPAVGRTPKVDSSAPDEETPAAEVGPLTTKETTASPDAKASESRAVAEARSAARAITESSIRVDVGLLDKLMNLVGELVLARNQVLQQTEKGDAGLGKAAQQLNLITSELQGGVMKTRMQPMAIVLNKFPRVVRDLARGFGKKVLIDMEGAETELDKSIIEAVKDPLTHLIRNAVDHGIEPPEDRIARAKPEEGRISLRVYHEGGQVTIEISDDGAGLDPSRIKAAAVEKGILSTDQAAAISDREAVNMIFRAGFSTVRTVTNVSGRGVGMDVVRQNIERMGGAVEVQSTWGSGTTFKLKIPLTLAIIPALIVRNGPDRYAIPQASLLELVRLTGDEAAQHIEYIHGVPVYRLRGRLLPLAYLSRELDGTVQERRDPHAAGPDAVNIAVLQADGRPFGLVVDEVSDTTEIVVKPLSRVLRDIQVFAAATILGDGRVALILDVAGLANRAGVLAELQDDALRGQRAEAASTQAGHQTLLLFSTPDSGRMAIPLSAVTRLEEFRRSAIERAGDQEVIQYRGMILPLIYVSDVLPERRSTPRSPDTDLSPSKDRIQVVVHSTADTTVGLVVDRIIDITDATVALERAGARRCVLGSAVIDGKVTEFLDIEAAIEQVAAVQTA